MGDGACSTGCLGWICLQALIGMELSQPLYQVYAIHSLPCTEHHGLKGHANFLGSFDACIMMERNNGLIHNLLHV